jgi:glycosyltransferase involved in cell wall biosynthesis
MNILFLHRDFPGQFKYIAPEIAKNPLNLVLFITAEDKIPTVAGINKLVYKAPKPSSQCHPYAKTFEENVLHGRAAAEIAVVMKQKGIIPDIIFAHSWGLGMFMKDVFPDVPVLNYFEWYWNAEGAVIGFDGKEPPTDFKTKLRASNAQTLVDLCSCDAGISPTEWQKKQFPKDFHDKIKVIHDGVDTEICKPDESASFFIPDKNLTLTTQDEVITYATRGMEPYRGFPQVMEAIEKLQKLRLNAHFIIGGEDRVCYGEKLSHGSYKQMMLKKLDLDVSRIHFVGGLTFNDYLKILQISSIHIYSTMPFVLSWSILEAMACECCVVASSTTPVLEVIKDSENGLLFDFYNVDELVEKVDFALKNPAEATKIKKNARQTIIEKYELKDCLARQLEYLNEVIGNK